MADTVFLCHNSADTDDVKELASHLKADGIEVWLDVWNLIAGEPFTPKIEEALERCTAAAVFFGQSGYSPYQNQEIQELLDRGLKGLRVIPLLLPGAPESLITGFLRTRTRVQFRKSLNEEDAYRALVSGIRGIPPGQLEETGTPSPPPLKKRPDDKQPYRGLLAFDVDDWDCFFGRKRLIAEAVQAIESKLNAGIRFLVIVGASGSGKSSLARAGVVHALEATHAGWKRVVFEPGAQPLDILAERMLKLTQPQVDGATIKQQATELLNDTGMVRRSALGALGNDPAKGRLILLVDQFEEIFTQLEDKKVRDAFIGNLLSAAKDQSGMTVVLICVRADFYENCAQTELTEVLSKQQILVGPMRRDELREAIREPAVQGGYDVEPELIASLINDCQEQPSPLPLLQIALQKLWLNRSPQGILTSAEYDKKRNLEGMIDEHANEVFANLPADQQASCLSLFLQLVEPLESGRYARKRVAMDSLLPAADPNDPKTYARIKQTQALIGTLSGRRARLITLRNEGGRVTIEIAHEAIFRGWEKLAALLDQNTEFLLWKKRLGLEIADWVKSKGESGFLSGVLLDRARGWLKERPDGHTEEDRKFIKASRDRLWWKRGVAAAAVGAVILLT
ncbi:MAG: toll/interleukin-1 receptor domain-containing protein, partial [Acidobacteriota bacterium]|nr:toll/interleukin-1 receptor domain-containing protein [Acidobacteriota bacterium]